MVWSRRSSGAWTFKERISSIPASPPVLPEEALGLPDFALVPQTVFDDETGLGLDTGLLERALGGLVGLVVLAWVSHDYEPPADFLLTPTVEPVLPVDLVRWPRTFWPVSCRMPR
jgi:hypothetical protein